MGHAALDFETYRAAEDGRGGDFDSALAALRGALEVLRDNPSLSAEDRGRFVAIALDKCASLRRDGAAAPIEPAPAPVAVAEPTALDPAIDPRFAQRIAKHGDLGVIDIDFSETVFESDADVNAFYDAIDAALRGDDRQWWFIVNYHEHAVWPEAWVAAGHRAKKVAKNYARAVVRYVDHPTAELAPRQGMVASRSAALAEVERLKAEEA